MRCTIKLITLTVLTLGNAASAQDATNSYGLTLAPGETIIEIYNAPSVVQMPAAPVYKTVPYLESQVYTPPVEIDRVTGLPRNQAGWSGDTGEPAGIGCFPQGVCAHLN